ncbi:hypothetical protein ACF1AX_31320 [Streptomyces sp. NPDC014802]|uniref:hypothetical protein n=1 Tax=Streptomyces sp. NPDC014802 TaxID=3364917 RepID=UPI0036F5A1AA
MEAEKRVVTVDRHEWTLKAPAHHTEVTKAVAVAEQDRARLASRGVRTGDVHVHAADDELIVAFEAERPRNPKRSMRDLPADEP